MSPWITDWRNIEDDKQYFICPINQWVDGRLCLGQPSFATGWQVKTHLMQCYAALECPAFNMTREQI